MRAGLLNKRLEFQSPSGTRDGVGQRQTVWTTRAKVWGRILPLSAQTRFTAAQSHASTTHRIWVRIETTLDRMDTSWRIKYNERYFTIDGIVDVKERGREYEIYCTEGLRNG